MDRYFSACVADATYITGYSFTGECLRLSLVLPSPCFANGHEADGGAAVVRALALHQCDPRQNLDPLPKVLVLVLALKKFPLGSPVFSSPPKSTLLNSNSMGICHGRNPAQSINDLI